MSPHLRPALFEAIGSFLLVLATSGLVVADGLAGTPGQGSPRWGMALAAGVAWTVSLALTLRVSGGFLNPAITVTLWVFQRIDNRKAVFLIAGQFVGAIVAGAVLRGLFFVNESALKETRLGVPHLNLKAFDVAQVEPSIQFQGIAVEGLLTFLLVLAVFFFIFDPRFRNRVGDGPYQLSYLWFGLMVALMTLLAVNLTGACMNPARWLGTVIWESTVASLQAKNPWADHGPYWIGPLLGSLLAGIVYTYVFAPADHKKGPPVKGMP